MAKRFINATGLHKIFNTGSETTLDITSIRDDVSNNVNENSIIFLTADSSDEIYGYEHDSKYIWAQSSLYPTNNTTSNIPVIDLSQSQQIIFDIDPNKMYMFGTKSSLTITMNPGASCIVNEYMFQFTSGSTATTLVVPNTVVWLKDPDIQANKKYAVSIENNLGIIGEWNNE